MNDMNRLIFSMVLGAFVGTSFDLESGCALEINYDSERDDISIEGWV